MADPLNRRFFLKTIVASTAVYTLGSAVKTVDGSLVAGAKTCSWMIMSAFPEYACGNVWVDVPGPSGPCAEGNGVSVCHAGLPGILTDYVCVCN